MIMMMSMNDGKIVKPHSVRRLPEREIIVHIKHIRNWLDEKEKETGRECFRLDAMRYAKMMHEIPPKGRKEALAKSDLAYFSTVLFNIIFYWPTKGDTRWLCRSAEGSRFTIRFMLKSRIDMYE